jgi:hypothetical protein
VSALFAHQSSAVSLSNDPVGLAKTPVQTLIEIADMLAEDDPSPRTLTLGKNGGDGKGMHTVVPYALEQDTAQSNLFHIYISDSNYPNSIWPITIDLNGNNGNGTWTTRNRVGWGGAGKLYLEVPADNYLQFATWDTAQGTPPNRASEASRSGGGLSSPFSLPADALHIYNKPNSPVTITDQDGRTTGFSGGVVQNEIPGSVPIGAKNGSEGAPLGYALPKSGYDILLNAFAADTAELFCFTGNRLFGYERTGTLSDQTDRLRFDGGQSPSEGAMTFVNPDSAAKSVSFHAIVEETALEKVWAVRSLDAAAGDSIRFETLDNNTLQLFSLGGGFYDLELRYVTPAGVKRFGASHVGLPPNTAHRYLPVWTDLEASVLEVWEDHGNDGSFEGVLYLTNELTGMKEQGSTPLPAQYRLGQNFPNPFNPSTTIEFSIPKSQFVSLKVFNALGQEVAVLVDGTLAAGNHSVSFDARQLPSGVYFYRISAGTFVESKKMVLMK